MSLARTLRQRFRPESKTTSDPHEEHKQVQSASVSTAADEFEVVSSSVDESDRNSFHSAASHSPTASLSVENRFRDGEEKSIYEQQLTVLQEQLVATMIENQNLRRKIDALEEKVDRDKTLALLEYERHRANMLEEKCVRLQKHKRSRRPQRSSSDVTVHSQLRRRLSVGDMTDIEFASEAEEDSVSEGSSDLTLSPSKSWKDRICERVLQFVYAIMDDFTDLPQQEQSVEPEDLAVRKLKENIRRAGAAAKPYISTAQGVYSLLTWKSPPYTLIVFIVYMYSVWYGWFLPLLFSCLTFRLTVNYLRYRGWNITFNFFDCHEEEKETDESKDMGMSDKFNLVLQVARQVQNFLGNAADTLEKIKSLLTWRHPASTKVLFLFLLASTLASCFLSSSTLFFIGGLYLGVKLFLLDYLFMRFPRLKMKYDSSYKIWLDLPTDLEYEKQSVKSEIDRYILPKSHEDLPGETADTSDADSLSVDDKQFCELFSFPLSEGPLPGWHGGRRCTLINRDKSFPSAFKNGRLYLTHSFLCFERTKSPSPKNIVVPLTDITRLEKAKPYPWMPGGGMAIEVAVNGSEKPYIFGAMINRDEVYESIIMVGQQANLPWAVCSELGSA